MTVSPNDYIKNGTQNINISKMTINDRGVTLNCQRTSGDKNTR